MWSIIVQAFQYSAENTSTIDPRQSLYDFFIERVAEIFPNEVSQERERKIVMQMSEYEIPDVKNFDTNCYVTECG